MPVQAERIYNKKGEWLGTLLMNIETGKIWEIISPERTDVLIKELKGENGNE